MAVTSPRTGFRGLRNVPTDWSNDREQLWLTSAAIRQLQEISRRQGHNVEVTSISATYSMVDIDQLILADATNTAITVNLLTAAGREGRLVEVKKIDSSANLVTIDPAGSETIDGSTTLVLSQQYALRGMRSDGANWHLVTSIGYTTGL